MRRRLCQSVWVHALTQADRQCFWVKPLLNPLQPSVNVRLGKRFVSTDKNDLA